VSAADILNAPWWTFILGGFSRVLAITAHLGFATLIMLAYRRSWLFYPLAIFVHFLVDFTTFGTQALTNSLLWTLIVFCIWAIASLFLLVHVRRMDLETVVGIEPHADNVTTTMEA
jgi:hypothetical protein